MTPQVQAKEARLQARQHMRRAEVAREFRDYPEYSKNLAAAKRLAERARRLLQMQK